MRLLSAAASHGRTVVVAMDSDARVATLKGPSRPILTWVERAVAMSYQPVNLLVEFGSEEDLALIVSSLQPDLRVCGSDKAREPGYFPPFEGKTLMVHTRGMSTSSIIERCRA
jgi:bifunctional ADP-heptose synthase (sugar kinase/adenylyltransferase)